MVQQQWKVYLRTLRFLIRGGQDSSPFLFYHSKIIIVLVWLSIMGAFPRFDFARIMLPGKWELSVLCPLPSLCNSLSSSCMWSPGSSVSPPQGILQSIFPESSAGGKCSFSWELRPQWIFRRLVSCWRHSAKRIAASLLWATGASRNAGGASCIPGSGCFETLCEEKNSFQSFDIGILYTALREKDRVFVSQFQSESLNLNGASLKIRKTGPWL